MSTAPADWVVLARLGKTRGLKGELLAESWNEPERLEGLERVWLRRQNGEWANQGEPLTVAELWPHKGGLVFRFEGFDTIEAAEPLEHCEVVVERGERPPLEEGEVYLADLVGCEVFDRSTGLKLGTVTGWQQYAGPVLLEVAIEGGEFLLPFARSICVEIDPANRRLGVDLPDGLVELNRSA